MQFYEKTGKWRAQKIRKKARKVLYLTITFCKVPE